MDGECVRSRGFALLRSTGCFCSIVVVACCAKFCNIALRSPRVSMCLGSAHCRTYSTAVAGSSFRHRVARNATQHFVSFLRHQQTKTSRSRRSKIPSRPVLSFTPTPRASVHIIIAATKNTTMVRVDETYRAAPSVATWFRTRRLPRFVFVSAAVVVCLRFCY